MHESLAVRKYLRLQYLPIESFISDPVILDHVSGYKIKLTENPIEH